MLLNGVTRQSFLILSVLSCIVIRYVIDASDDMPGAVQSGFHAAVTAMYVIIFPLSNITTTLVIEVVGLQVLQLIGLLIAEQLFWDFTAFALVVFYAGLLVNNILSK